MSTLEDSKNLSGDYRWLWEIEYDCLRRIVRSVPGTGEVETVGRERYVAKYHVIAPDEELAKTLWRRDFVHDTSSANLMRTCTKLLRVDAEISIRGSRA